MDWIFSSLYLLWQLRGCLNIYEFREQYDGSEDYFSPKLESDRNAIGLYFHSSRIRDLHFPENIFHQKGTSKVLEKITI